MTQNTLHQRPLLGFERRNSKLLTSCLLACLALGASACGQTEVDQPVGSTVANLGEETSHIDIQITSPNHGDFHRPPAGLDDTVTVIGEATGVFGLEIEVEVNGYPATVSHDGETANWSVDVPVSTDDVFNELVAELHVPSLNVTAVDLATVIAGQSVDETDLAHLGLGMRVTGAAFDKLEPLVASMVPDVTKQIPQGRVSFLDPNKSIYEQFPNFALDYFLDITISDVSSSGVKVDLDAGNGVVNAKASLTNLFLRIEAVAGAKAFDTPEIDQDGIGCVVDISVDEISVDAGVELVPTASSLFAVKQVGDTKTNVRDLVWDFSSGICSIPGIENLIDMFVPDIEAMLESEIAKVADFTGPIEDGDSQLSAAIEQALNEFKLVSPITFTTEVTGVVYEDATGLTYGADSAFHPNFGVSGCELGSADPTKSLLVESTFPTFGDVTPNLGLPYDVALAISPTAWNQFFRAQTECGLPEHELGEIDFGNGPQTIYAGYLDDHVPGFEEVHRAKRLGMRITPTLAPVVTGRPGPALELLDVLISGYMLEIYDPMDPETVYLAAALSGRFGVNLAVVSGNLQASANAPSVGDIGITVFGGIIDATAADFERLAPSIIAPVVSAIARRFGRFPVPAPKGVSFSPVEVALVDDVPTAFLSVLPGSCKAGYEPSSDGMCYEECDAGYDADGGTCWKDCPAEFTDYVKSCHHDVEIVHKESTYRGAGTIPTCGSLEKDGELCYPKCASGYDGEGPTCWQLCPSGYKDDGAFCRKDAIIISKKNYYRGSGTAMTCASSEERYGGLCYPKCKSGYKGVGSRCYKNCASGYKDDGLTCRRNVRSIKKSTSGCPWYNLCCASCPSGYRNDGCFCTRDARIYSKSSYYRGSGKPVRYCPSGTKKYGSLCYPKCNSGYKGVGSRCWKICPSGYKDDGATCRKDAIINAKYSYGRGSGTIPSTCSSSQELEEGLCYSKCASDEDGAGLYCYKECASKYTDDGLFCRIDETTFAKGFYQRDGFYP